MPGRVTARRGAQACGCARACGASMPGCARGACNGGTRMGAHAAARSDVYVCCARWVVWRAVGGVAR
eukprot:2119912-Prymnesium_polylepis.1